MILQTETEEKIVLSAEKLFHQKGKAGTSMQDIADELLDALPEGGRYRLPAFLDSPDARGDDEVN